MDRAKELLSLGSMRAGVRLAAALGGNEGERWRSREEAREQARERLGFGRGVSRLRAAGWAGRPLGLMANWA